MEFFDTVVLQALSRRFHRRLDDAMLDRCAADCGCIPIGRMCLLNDQSVASIVRECNIRDGTSVLDFGCGRGFFGRWLNANGITAPYSGVDRDETAVAAARRHIPHGAITRGDFRTTRTRPRYDVVTAIEVTIAGAVDAPLLDAAAGALLPKGRLALTLASIDGAHRECYARNQAKALSRFTEVRIEDWTTRVTPFARRTFQWWLAAEWPSEIRTHSTLEARTALDAIARGTFHYAILFAQK